MGGEGKDFNASGNGSLAGIIAFQALLAAQVPTVTPGPESSLFLGPTYCALAQPQTGFSWK